MNGAKTCARCGRRLNPDASRIYSRFTHQYYCTNFKTCDKRARRMKRAAA